jgi:hypothetical protein
MKYIKIANKWIEVSDEEAREYERAVVESNKDQEVGDTYYEYSNCKKMSTETKALIIAIISFMALPLLLQGIYIFIEYWAMDALQKLLIYWSILFSETDFAHLPPEWAWWR